MKIITQVTRELSRRWLTWGVMVLAVLFMLLRKMDFFSSLLSSDIVKDKWANLIVLSFIVWILIFACQSLTNICNLRRNELGITWCQISILLLLGTWIIGFAIIFDIANKPKFAATLGIVGSVLTWIFQDTIKGVVAFIHLRLNNQIHIGDWIEIPKHNVDGEVSSITLTHVTFYNWDTSTSSIPTCLLHSEHVVNYQNMMMGKTFGRRMYMTFILDTGWFHTFTEKEKDKIENTGDILDYLSKDEIVKSKSNAQLFRLYLYHWLMNHSHISQQPRLIVRWQEQKEQGMPLQVYAFIIDSSLPSFEWQQSQIVEHILESLDWFGLRLYQSPSAYDASNSNVYLSDKPATYRKEE